MITETKIRNQILRRIERIPGEQLSELDRFLKNLESRNLKKDRILSYAGAWKDMDEDVFQEFIMESISRREENKRRKDEKSAD